MNNSLLPERRASRTSPDSVSGALRDYWTPLVALFADNLRRFERGEPLLNVVDKIAGY